MLSALCLCQGGCLQIQTAPWQIVYNIYAVCCSDGSMGERQNNRRGAVMVTHDERVLDLVDKIYTMEDGKLNLK